MSSTQRPRARPVAPLVVSLVDSFYYDVHGKLPVSHAQWDANRAAVSAFATTVEKQLQVGVPIDLLFNAFLDWFDSADTGEMAGTSFAIELNRRDILVAVFLDLGGYVKKGGSIVTVEGSKTVRRRSRKTEAQCKPPPLTLGSGEMAPPYTGKDVVADMARLRALIAACPQQFPFL